MGKLTGIVFALIILTVPLQLSAAVFDGSSPLLCAFTEAFECSIDRGCQEGNAEDMNIPQFIRIDVSKNKVTSAEVNEEKRESDIKNLEHNNGMLILQGVEGGRGWNVVIAEDTGHMSGTATEDEGGFIVFGACTLD